MALRNLASPNDKEGKENDYVEPKIDRYSSANEEEKETDFQNVLVQTQSWKMSNLLHGPISTNQILPREKRVNRDIFGTSNLQNRTYGVSCDE